MNPGEEELPFIFDPRHGVLLKNTVISFSKKEPTYGLTKK